jgi:hypothetical protein
MIDSLTLALMIVTTPVSRPNMDRASKIIAPNDNVKIVALATKEAIAGRKFTTCYENNTNSCWSAN